MTKTIFMMAGETSGDELGAALIRSLREQSSGPLKIVGVGGDKMIAEGLESLLPMSELNVMGLWEVIGHLPRLLRLMGAMVEEIEARNPDAVVTIDLPDFNFGVASRLRKRGTYKGKLIHYVAPSVWAWRPKRAEKISQFLDGIICLFPFEPAYFPAIKSVYAGHSMVENVIDEGAGARFRETQSIPQDVKTLGLFFGSRVSELNAVKNILLQSAALVREQYPDLRLIIPTLPHLEYEIFQIVGSLDYPVTVVSTPSLKWDALMACDAAIAVSGTVGLELAYAGVPHVITYKVNPLTWAIMKLLVKVKYAHLGNILLDEPAIGEFLQYKSEPVGIGKAILRLYRLADERGQQIEKMKRIREILRGGDDKPPSARAADFVLSFIDG